jgi:hypothetical protein
MTDKDILIKYLIETGVLRDQICDFCNDYNEYDENGNTWCDYHCYQESLSEPDKECYNHWLELQHKVLEENNE